MVVKTGASSGIGRQSAIEFARLGASVVLVSRNKEKLEDAAKELSKYKSRTMVCVCDVSRKDQVGQMRSQVIEKLGSVDVLVNNAGFGIYGDFASLQVEDIEAQMATNFLGMVY